MAATHLQVMEAIMAAEYLLMMDRQQMELVVRHLLIREASREHPGVANVEL